MKLHPGWTIRFRVVYFAYLGFRSSRCFFPCFLRNAEFSGKVFCVSCFLLQWALKEMGNCSRWRQIFQPSSGWWVGPVFSFSFFSISSKGCLPSETPLHISRDQVLLRLLPLPSWKQSSSGVKGLPFLVALSVMPLRLFFLLCE